ncbi:hypothetical protein ACRAWG_21610 [Methylobacterium sp. P31]
MEIEVLRRPARLAVWRAPFSEAHAALQHFTTLEEAIRSAALALVESAAQPWIVTDEGEILPPSWIRFYLNQSIHAAKT